jgi:hypothetical protein
VCTGEFAAATLQILGFIGFIFTNCIYFADAFATQMNGQMTLNTVSSCKVSPQNEFLNVLATQINRQMTLNIGSSCKVSHQNELLNVSPCML